MVNKLIIKNEKIYLNDTVIMEIDGYTVSQFAGNPTDITYEVVLTDEFEKVLTDTTL